MILDHKIVFLYLNLYCNDSHMLSGSLAPAALCETINKLYKIKTSNMLDPDNYFTLESIHDGFKISLVLFGIFITKQS